MEGSSYQSAGTLTDDGTIRLDEPVACPPGPVEVVIIPGGRRAARRVPPISDDEVRTRNNRLMKELDRWAADRDDLSPEQEAELRRILDAGVHFGGGRDLP